MTKKQLLGLVVGLCALASICESGSDLMRSVATGDKLVALTFDDGPSIKVTEKMLELFKEEEVKATFFMLGKHVMERKDLVVAVLKAGHEVGNHSMTHARLNEQEPAVVAHEIGAFQTLMQREFKYTATSFRAPYLAYSSEVWIQLREQGLTAIDASIFSMDWEKGITSKLIIQYVTTQAKPGAIVLMHEREETLKALPEIISFYKNAGYSFVTISELLEKDLP